MKHNKKITLILIAMFFLTQIIGLGITSVYHNGLLIPYGMQPPTGVQEPASVFSIFFSSFLAIMLFLLLIRIKSEKILITWFFLVTVIALGLSFNVIIYLLAIPYSSLFALLIALPVAYLKVFKKNVIIHNLSELLVYPGIAAIFIPLLGVLGIIILLLVISLYDIWAVWKSQFMQKLAKYQMDTLGIFSGFFIPYADKKTKLKIRQLKDKYVNQPEKLEKAAKKSNLKINLAILGGGDVVFPIITAGVFYKSYGLFPALIIILFATISLSYLLLTAQKKKFYPAMPFITIGLYLGMILSWILF